MNSRRVSGGFVPWVAINELRPRHTRGLADLGLGRLRLRAVRLAAEGTSAAVRRDRDDGALLLRQLAAVDVRCGSRAHRRGVLAEEKILNHATTCARSSLA